MCAVFWNLENCFDYKDNGTGSSDKEFSSFGERRWTREKFDKKVALIGKTLLWCGLPEVVGLCEVENAGVLKRICNSDLLRKCSYRYVHYDSADPRGIDVALIYRESEMEVLESYPIHIRNDRGEKLATRDILYVCLQERASGELWHFFVNHHPSKYSGSSSVVRRKAAMATLMCSVDSLLRSGCRNIVAMGDFNDIPYAESFSSSEGKLANMGKKLCEEDKDKGSIRYKGQWQLIDNFLVSPQVEEKMQMEVLMPPFLLVKDKEFPGVKPLRTYSGPRWLGGVSDHLPVRLNYK